MLDAYAPAHLLDDIASEVQPVPVHLFTSLAADRRKHGRPLLFSEAVTAFRRQDEEPGVRKYANASSPEHCEWPFELYFAVEENSTN